MARVTEAEVREIIKDVSADYSDLTPFIAAATAMVDQRLDDSALGLSVALLKEIERWIAAHLVAVADPRRIEEKMGDGTDKFQAKLGNGLRVTHWGQTAIALDTSGTLKKITDGKGTGMIQTITPDLGD